MRVLYHLAYPNTSTRSDVFLIERFIAALNNREVQNHMRWRKPITYAAALAAANEETSFVLMDLATHAPGGVQAATPGDTSFIAALKAQRSVPNTGGTNTTEKRHCFYCDGEGHIRDRCPMRLRDCLRQQTRMGTCRPSQALGRVRPLLHRSSALGTKQVKFAEATNTLPIIAKSYGKRRIAALEEDVGASGIEDDPLEDVDLTAYDEATLAALYEELQDLP